MEEQRNKGKVFVPCAEKVVTTEKKTKQETAEKQVGKKSVYERKVTTVKPRHYEQFTVYHQRLLH